MISGGILQATNVPESFNALTCTLSWKGGDIFPSELYDHSPEIAMKSQILVFSQQLKFSSRLFYVKFENN